MVLGPIEILCVKFPATAIPGSIATALKSLVDSQMIRIVDILFIHKNESGEVQISEVDEMEDVDHSLIDPLIADISGLIADEDVHEIAQTLDEFQTAKAKLLS